MRTQTLRRVSPKPVLGIAMRSISGVASGQESGGLIQWSLQSGAHNVAFSLRIHPDISNSIATSTSCGLLPVGTMYDVKSLPRTTSIRSKQLILLITLFLCPELHSGIGCLSPHLPGHPYDHQKVTCVTLDTIWAILQGLQCKSLSVCTTVAL